ncbi:U-box domain-containing protein 12-like isoform X1 [Zingiber officinale]|uniref:U-box domain-containing protein 12-like isoform X1 n=1 Tax=Zingiber officinale TaxID=94328 RepID=UPI001C4D7178|nr:U-box domain-containing protein 12-like isoform X1 [Zingiber officinale]
MGSTEEGPEISGGVDGVAVVEALSGVVEEVTALPENRGPLRRMSFDLAQRVKLLAPLFDELRDDAGSIRPDELRGLESLRVALVEAKEILRLVNAGSRLYQVLRSSKFEISFQMATESIEKAINEICLDNLNIPLEVKEQIELLHSHLHRAKETVELPDLQLHRDLSWALNENYSDISVIKRISEKLQLKNKNDIIKESVALNEMVISSDGEPDVSLDDMSLLLKKINDCVLSENLASASMDRKTSFSKHRSPVIPDDFRCPMSLELMKDPVIISSGLTYERSYIQKWLENGHKTCPKTQQPLSHTILTPNFILKSLIVQWCDANGIELNKKHSKPENNSDCNQAGIKALMSKLANGSQEEQRAAAGELRLLAKRNADNRICIAEAGAIPLLIQLLSSPDPRTQEHAVTALLNLSINDDNKHIIVKEKAIPKIVEVLQSETMEARENAAATLFSLSVVDSNKILIGEAGAIPLLISLLCEGSPRGKKDAATAIFNLCIYNGNKLIAVKAGIVDHLITMLVDPTLGMIDETLAILAILSNNQDGKTAIASSHPIPLLVKLMKSGSSRVRESAAALMYSLCSGVEQNLKVAKEVGAEEALKELLETGTERAKRKAGSLLALMHQGAEPSEIAYTCVEQNAA